MLTLIYWQSLWPTLINKSKKIKKNKSKSIIYNLVKLNKSKKIKKKDQSKSIIYNTTYQKMNEIYLANFEKMDYL